MENSKPGIKTSEFWITLITPLIIALIAGLADNFGITVDKTMIATLVSPAVLYIFSRAWVKGKEAETAAVQAHADASVEIANANAIANKSPVPTAPPHA